MHATLKGDLNEWRILILAPTRRDAALSASILHEHHIESVICADVQAMVRELNAGAGAILLAEEVVAGGQSQPIANAIASQSPWSDLPVLLITAQGADSPAVAVALRTLGNVMLVERPTRIPTLLNNVQSALRARTRQYQARDYLREREQTAETLKQADRRKDEFLATLAHELRNPLAPIRNSLQILRMTTGRDSSKERVYEVMERQVNHLVRLVDDLMEVSRITRGMIDLRKEETDLSAVIQCAIETSRPMIEAGRHELALALPPEQVPIYGDMVRLAQIFSNLLNNAAKYTDAGGNIRVSARREGNQAVVSVKDNGIGIPKEMLPNVFELFTQGDPAANYSQGGLGIGLTLVKNLVELHEGTVSVQSEGPGRGSEFTVRLPLVTSSLPKSVKPAMRQEPLNIQRRVLVVDDNQDAAISLGMLLNFLGAEVRIANDGPTALQSIESYRPDAVMLDIGMPGMDGLEVARRIRKHKDLDDVMLIALTGWGQAEDRKRTHEAGFDHHLVKPADISVLQSLLTKVGVDTRSRRLQ
ncbi:MAG TPA: ATP-binding protein [Gammaproteobacteria bacterium]